MATFDQQSRPPALTFDSITGFAPQALVTERFVVLPPEPEHHYAKLHVSMPFNWNECGGLVRN